jgi:hypothetical protein
MLVSILFENFGYDYNAWKNWETKILNPNFKCKVVNNELLINAASISENIIIERLADGSYQDYGGNLRQKLGSL